MKNIKRNLLVGLAMIIGTFALALPALAASTASFIPANTSVTAGDSFNVIITLDPQGVSNYADKIAVDYPAGLLQVSSFSPGSNWISMTQSGYDLLDNTKGLLIKTAGYPGGVSSPTIFGTITFVSKGTGSGVINLDGSSLYFTSGSQGTVVANNAASFAIVASAPVYTVVPVTPNVTVTPTKVGVSTKVTTNSTTTVVKTPQASDQLSQAAAVSESNATTTAGISNNMWIWIVTVIVLIIIGIIIYFYIRPE